MIIIKRKYATPKSSIPIWGIPLCSYIIQKSIGIISQEKDIYWFFSILISFLGWAIINFKLTKTNKL